MSNENDTLDAEKIDRSDIFAGFTMLFMAFAYGLQALNVTVDTRVLDVSIIVLKLVSVGFAVLVLWPYLKHLDRSDRHKCSQHSPGFIRQMFDQACVVSWMLSFFGLIIVTIIMTFTSQIHALQLPFEFYVYTMLSFMLLVAALTFFYLIRSDKE